MKKQTKLSKPIMILVLFLAFTTFANNQNNKNTKSLITGIKLISNNDGDDNFGYSVSLSGDWALIGAFADDSINGNFSETGAVYFYHYENNQWVEKQKIHGAAVLQKFGFSVSLSGTRALIGDGGADINFAYIYDYNGTSWVLSATLTPNDGAANHQFGQSVSLSKNGNRAIVGDWSFDSGSGQNETATGAVYVFDNNGGTSWTKIARLEPSDPTPNAWFSWSLSVSGDSIIVGDYNKDGNFNDYGAIYIFEKTNGVWSEKAKLYASDAQSDDLFGWSVDIDDNRAVVGAHGDDDNAANSGSVYVFEKDNGVWTEKKQKLMQMTQSLPMSLVSLLV